MEKEEKAQESMMSQKPREQSFKNQGSSNSSTGWNATAACPGTAPGASLEEQKSCELKGDCTREVESTCEVNPFEKALG